MTDGFQKCMCEQEQGDIEAHRSGDALVFLAKAQQQAATLASQLILCCFVVPSRSDDGLVKDWMTHMGHLQDDPTATPFERGQVRH